MLRSTVAMRWNSAVLRVLFDVLVNRVTVLQDASNQRVGEQAHFGLLGGGRRQFDRLAPGGRAFFPGDGCCALRVPEFIERPIQVFRRVQIVLEQKLHGTFARLHVVWPIIQLHHATEMQAGKWKTALEFKLQLVSRWAS